MHNNRRSKISQENLWYKLNTPAVSNKRLTGIGNKIKSTGYNFINSNYFSSVCICFNSKNVADTPIMF